MRLLTCILTLTALVLGIPRMTQAQVGSLDDRTEYAIVTGASRNGEHGPLLAIVLWRGEPGWTKRGTGEATSRSGFTNDNARVPSDQVNMSFSAGGNVSGVVDHNYRRLTTEGREFALAPSDSALVVMVTVPPRGGPRVISTARISSTLPESYWMKRWQHGDTTFIVHADFVKTKAMLLDALRQSPAVAEFLH